MLKNVLTHLENIKDETLITPFYLLLMFVFFKLNFCVFNFVQSSAHSDIVTLSPTVTVSLLRPLYIGKE